MLSFPPFQLDIEDERLWKNGEEAELRRKPFAILRYLAQNPQRLVRHEELVGAVWGGKPAMSESLLRTHLCELRQVLGKGVIETVVGRGYRFLPEVRLDLDARRRDEGARATESGSGLVGRETEQGLLGRALAAASDRKRTTLFVSGDAGIGKTTLVDTFLERATVEGSVLVGWGTCVEQFGDGEAYLPVLEAIGALCRGPGANRVIEVLDKHAPAWLIQLPGVVRPDRRDDLQRRAAGVTPAGAMCELADALEVLSAHAPIVLVLDDLQRVDLATARLITFLSRRREPARLLIIGTYRSREVRRGHPVTKVAAELIAHRLASSIEVGGLSSEDVDAYLSRRYPRRALPAELARTLQATTGGSPLALSTLVDTLEREGVLRQRMGHWELSTTVAEVATRPLDDTRELFDVELLEDEDVSAVSGDEYPAPERTWHPYAGGHIRAIRGPSPAVAAATPRAS
jgi:DNA-binding winged helix-turn-helix (wHTH) protein